MGKIYRTHAQRLPRVSNFKHNLIFIFQSRRSISCLSEGEAVSTIDYHIDDIVSTKNEVHQFRHVAHGDHPVAVDVGILDDAVIVFHAQDVVHQQSHVRHVDGTVAVHVTCGIHIDDHGAVMQLEVGATSVHVVVIVGIVERVVFAQEEHRTVVLHYTCG